MGFKRKAETGGQVRWEYLILPEMWKTEVCQGLDAVRAAKAVRDAGYLVTEEGRDLTRKVSIPGEGRPRVYVIRGAILGDEEA